jgi:uncharacterized protein YciI
MYYAVIREQGADWDGARALREQSGWPEHAAFMDMLAEEGFVLLAGPLGDGTPPHRALLVVDAGSEAAIHERLAADPWTPRMLTTAMIARWEVLIGAPAASDQPPAAITSPPTAATTRPSAPR